jgi:hypothetical protein
MGMKVESGHDVGRSLFESGWRGGFVMIMSRDGVGWTNTVLVQRQGERETYYLPCYLRLKVKNFLSLSPASQQAEINADLLFCLYYGALPVFAVE